MEIEKLKYSKRIAICCVSSLLFQFSHFKLSNFIVFCNIFKRSCFFFTYCWYVSTTFKQTTCFCSYITCKSFSSARQRTRPHSSPILSPTSYAVSSSQTTTAQTTTTVLNVTSATNRTTTSGKSIVYM